MYLRNIFNSKAVQKVATFGSLAFGLYNLYVMGRTDEIEEICQAVEHEEDGRCLPFKRMDGKGRMDIYMTQVHKYDRDSMKEN